jgi:pimeloyl-ACP methyl ester carboxylesterase
MKAQTAERRARLLVRCYPPAWRTRYGDEFVQLLVDEISERPRSLSLTADVVRSGVIARPAVWTTYAQARTANAGAFASAADFASDDVITHASALTGMPVRIASGTDDPFHPGVVALADAMPKSAVVEITAGCHDHSFFSSQQHQSLAFLGRHLTRA